MTPYSQINPSNHLIALKWYQCYSNPFSLINSRQQVDVDKYMEEEEEEEIVVS